MLKSSKFNHSVRNDLGELLITNSFSGYMVKVSKNNSEYINTVIKENMVNEDNSIVKKLINAGVLINNNENEDMRLLDCYLDIQSSSILSLTILPTEQCNFRCVYCPEDFKIGKMSKTVQNAIIDYVRKCINLYTGVRVSWFGGEPLLAMDVISYLSTEIMKICKNAKRSYIANITTNAYLLTYDVFCQLLNYNVLSYQITIDGLKETHNTQRVLINKGPTYDEIVKNLIQIKTKSNTGRFSVVIRTNLTKSMIADIPKYIDWYLSAFGDDFRFKISINKAEDFGGSCICNVKNELISKAEDENSIYNALSTSNISRVILANRRFFQRGGVVCEASKKNSMIIDASGNIKKCTCYLNDNSINNIGNILKYEEINKKDSNIIRWYTLQLQGECKNCFYSPVCLGMSCAYANIMTGKAICPNEKIQFDNYMKIYDKQGFFKKID